MKYSISVKSLTGIVILTVILIYTNAAFSQDAESNCLDCHGQLDEELAFPVAQARNDVHFSRGIVCVDCHGGDGAIDPQGDLEVAMDPQKGFVGAVSKTEIPEFCDRCHGDSNYMKSYNPNIRVDQFERYKTSVHGQRIEEGDENVAVCTDCHAIHSMRSVGDPASQVYPLNVSDTCGKCHGDANLMKEYDISADQISLYKLSVHYEFLEERGDMASPTCNDCHGNHGAVPPGVESIYLVCGTCHISNKELFVQSPHYQAFKDMDMPECVTCHSNHDITYTGDFMLSADEGVCWMCHDVDSDKGRTILAISSELESLHSLSMQADSLISLAELRGMEVVNYKFQLMDLQSNMHIARNLVHSFSLETIREETEKGKELAASIIDGGNNALAEIDVRRTGLLVFLLFTVLVIIGLIMKIRALPENSKK